MLIKAPAKINLTLRILSKRADGYHEISSIMRAIRLFDEVEISCGAGAGGGPPAVSVRADSDGVPEGRGNLAYRAAELMLGIYPGRIGQVEIELRKSIPVAAGLAGGSADAAAVLLGLAGELSTGAALSDIAGLGADLGMDVPFCVYSCAAANPCLGYGGAVAALAEGAGELLRPLKMPEKAWVVLVKPPVEIPTKEVYEIYDLWRGSASASENDLEAPCAEAWPIVSGSLAKLKRICAEEGAGDIKIQLSGSGPTVFAYFEGARKDEAERVFAEAKKAFAGASVFLTETLC